MQVNTLALQHIFEKDIQYRVPLYQRPYIWDEERQWQYLWDDIRRLADAALDGENVGYHFLGATVQDIQTVPPGTQETRLIIDGQQRLTTLQIISKAFRDVVRKHKNDRYSEAARRLAFNSHPLSTTPTDKFKIWPTNADREAFQRVMEASSPSDLLASYGRRSDTFFVEEAVADAYLYFYRKIDEWIGPDAPEKRINAMYVTMRERLRLVVIDLDQGDDAQMIFETLNARGTPLLAADLVKNSLLAEIEKMGCSAGDAYERFWKPFDLDQAFWRAEVGQGHARRARIEGLMHYSISLLSQQESAASELYTAYKKFARGADAGTPLDRMKAFRRYGDIYRRIIDGVSDVQLSRFLYRLDAMGVGTAFPFLIMLFDEHRDDFSLLREICARLDSFLVRRMVCRLPTRGYSTLFFDLIATLRNSADPVGALDARLRSGQGENERWPDDTEFGKAWLGNPLYSQLTRGRMRMLLETLEEEMRTGGKAESDSCPRDLTIEHIMPQTWETNWPLLIGHDGPTESIARDRLIQTVGNLTLLTDKLNKAQSNMAWLPADGREGKRAALRKQTVLHLNKTLADEDAWDDDSIIKRGIALLNRATHVWTAPS